MGATQQSLGLQVAGDASKLVGDITSAGSVSPVVFFFTRKNVTVDKKKAKNNPGRPQLGGIHLVSQC